MPSNAIIPLVSHSRKVNVDPAKFDSIFTGVKRFDDVKSYLVIIGILLSIVFIVISILLYIKLGNIKKVRLELSESESESSKKRNLIR